MSTTMAATDLLEARWRAMGALDDTVSALLSRCAAAWGIAGDPVIERTDYACIYRRAPSLGGHWTLFGTSQTDSVHQTAMVTVAAEFDDDRPVDLWVSGVHDVIAGGCTSAALAEALEQCGGPLRQVTPITYGRHTTGASSLMTLLPEASRAAIGQN